MTKIVKSMILGFSTRFPKGSGRLTGQPTYFVEKVIACLHFDLMSGSILNDFLQDASKQLKYKSKQEFIDKIISLKNNTKKHTIRGDKKGRWILGRLIDFFIGVRTKSMFRFAPKVPVISTQEISIKHYEKYVCIGVENKDMEGVTTLCFYHKTKEGYKQCWNGTNLIERIALNDGFDSVDDFFEWFIEDFKGKIIHWTELTYE